MTSLKSISSNAAYPSSLARMISMYFMVVLSLSGSERDRPPHFDVERDRAGSTSWRNFLPQCFHGRNVMASNTLGGYTSSVGRRGEPDDQVRVANPDDRVR